MEAILEQLFHSPKLNLYVREIQSLISKEREKRERFYEEIEEDQKAEFINGEIIVHSPVKIEHEFVSSNLLMLLRAHIMAHHMGYAGHEKMMITLTRNDYEPDICFWKKDKASGFRPGQWKFPAPDFVAEVLSPSTEKTDRTIKMEDYAAHGIGEYWIIDPATQIVEQYVLEKHQYRLRIKADSGILKSQVIQGFEIPVRALFDEAENLGILREILSP